MADTYPPVQIVVYDNEEKLLKDEGGVNAGQPSKTWSEFCQRSASVTRICRLKYVVADTKQELPTLEAVQKHFGEIVPRLSVRRYSEWEQEA